MIACKRVSVTSTPQSINTLFGVTLNFTKIRFSPSSGVQYGDSTLDPSSNEGLSIPGSLPNIQLDFDPDDDPGNNLFLAAISSASVSVFVW